MKQQSSKGQKDRTELIRKPTSDKGRTTPP